MLNGLVTSLTTTLHLTAIDHFLVVKIDFYRFVVVVVVVVCLFVCLFVCYKSWNCPEASTLLE
jgi:hypothetical protein